MLGLRERMEENSTAPPSPMEGKRSAAAPPDAEVVDKPTRRRFSPSYKQRIVEEADRCTEPGEVGRLLRREGLYSSHLTTWRKASRSGSLKGLSKKRGRKPSERNPLEGKLRKLERENARLEEELRKAHLIIDVQGKVAGLLGLSLEDGTNS
jgi:transposase